jgi:hypothetical protein
VIKPDVEKYWQGVSIGLLAFAGVLVILGGIVLGMVCKESKGDNFVSTSKIDSFQTEGRPLESRGTYKYIW